jgi:hypothetical protein
MSQPTGSGRGTVPGRGVGTQGGSAGGPPRGTSRDEAPRRPSDAVGASDRRHTRPTSAAVYRRRRLVVLVGLLVVVALLLAFLAWVWPGFARSGATAGEDPAPTVTVTADAPSPTLEPVARTGTTTFAQALPDTVLDLVLRSETVSDGWSTAGALEAHQLVYADGEGDGATTVTVVAGQWATPAEAEVAMTALVTAAGEPTGSGDVEVGGETAGQYAVIPGADGQATVTWRNGTAVLQATGPSEVVEDVYAAYPL